MKTIRNILLACAVLSCVSMPVWGGPATSCMNLQSIMPFDNIVPVSFYVAGKEYTIDGYGLLDLCNEEFTDKALTTEDLHAILINIINNGVADTIKVLNLMHNNLVSLPPEIGQLTNLKELYIDGNQLISLSAEIGQLKKLEILILYGNDLTFLPAEIGQLTSLKHLDLSGNNLASLPSEIGQLTKLKKLYLMGNPQLIALPVVLLEKERLRGLKIWR